jgi:hypothetical protein
MPCSPRKTRILLKEGRAKAIKNHPLVIQLTQATGEQIQKCSLGIDSGAKNVGFSVITDKKEIVTGELILDQKTSERLTEKRMYRRNRRNKLWYRKPRFNNRKKSDGWLPPSIQRKFNTHISLINKLKKLLPIKMVTVEVGNFDIQKINNPEIEGSGYQQGDMFGYQNMRSFIMARESSKCQLCGKKSSKNNWFHIHHIVSRSNGGTNSQKNLALLHKKCHDKLHNKGLYNLLKKNKTYKEATFMNIIKSKFQEFGFNLMYGYKTYIKRSILKLEKTHYNDAFIIAGGNKQGKVTPITLKQKHKNNRSLQLNRKGFKPSIRSRRYPIQPYDLITVEGNKYVVKGSFNLGTWVSCINKNFNIKKLSQVFHTGSIYLT